MTTSRTLHVKVIAVILCCCAAAVSTSLMADDHTIASGVVETLSNVTESTRTRKYGDGTLIFTGDNSLYGVYACEGTLKFNGGTTTVEGPGGADKTTATFAYAGATTIIEGGATVIVNNTSGYSSLGAGGSFMVTNGTYDITGKEFLNGFNSATSARIIVQDEGVLKAYRIRVSQSGSGSAENIGVFLNPGGKMYIKEFGMFDNDPARHGVIRFNGGLVIPTAGGDFFYNSTSTSWTNVKPYVDEGGFHMSNDVSTVNMNMPLLSGAASDGGVHYSSSGGKWIQLSGTFGNSTFNGGTWLYGNAVLINQVGDGGFGAQPTSPTNNINICGSATLFGGGSQYTIHRNRNIKLFAGVTAMIACNSEGTGMRIGGEMSVPDGDGAAMDTILKIGDTPKDETWGGFVVLDPGEGRTNLLDRIYVVRNLEIASGVTIVRSPSNGTDAGAPIYVAGNNSAYTSGYKSYGNLKVSGGKLVIEGRRYMEANKWGQVLVNGGTISGMTDKAEYLNGLSSTPGRLTIENGGKVEFSLVRIGQGWDYESEINVNTGGVLRASQICMGNKSKASLNLNGGTIVSYESPTMSTADRNLYRNNFLGDDSDKWERANVRVLAGGAKFNTDGYSPTVRTPLLSGVGVGETDGGLTKLGDGTLTMTTTNTYNGVTRLEGGTLAFSHANGRPDGDIEFAAAGLANCANAPLLTAKSLSFRSGCGIRVTECDTIGSKEWRRGWRAAATFDADIADLPTITYVRSDGTVASSANGWDGLRFRISADRKSIEFNRTNGTRLILR